MTVLTTGEDNCQRQMPTLTRSSLWGSGRATEPPVWVWRWRVWLWGGGAGIQQSGSGWGDAKRCLCVCVWKRERLGSELLGHPNSKSCVGIRWGCEIWTRSGLLWDAGFFPLPLFLGPRDDGEASFPVPFFNHLLQELSKMKMNGQCQPQAPGNVKEEDNWRHWCQSRSWETS